MAQLHESFTPQAKIKTASNRSFGLTMAAFFMILSLYAFWKSMTAPVVTWGMYTTIVSLLFFFTALFKAALLAPLNKVWTEFGLLLNKVTQPLFMFVLYFLVLTPFSIIFRKLAKKDLPMEFEPQKETYWIKKEAYASAKASMKNQF